jgi:hypothetical protein
MTTYDLLRTIEPTRMNEFVRAGIIAQEWRRSVRVYEYFMECCKKTGKMDAYDLTGEKFCMSDENVRKIIRRLNAEA